MPETILIIGAGPAGLYAAYRLSALGYDVTILEAREKPGGRIHTLQPQGFSQQIEAGAEFIHGAAPLTHQLLKEAGLSTQKLAGNFLRSKNGELFIDQSMDEYGEDLMEKLLTLETDISVKRFLEQEFPSDKFRSFRQSMLRYVESYDAANANRASSLALKNNWEDENSDQQSRVTGGYDSLIQFLLNECLKHQCRFRFNTTASRIEWQQNNVIVHANQNIYEAQKLIFTAPLNLLMQPDTTIHFEPSIPQLQEAIQKLGFGNVIKIIIEFDYSFWNSILIKDSTKKAFEQSSFVFSDEPVPTWWTQDSGSANLLTGWIAGPRTEEFAGYSNSEFEKAAMDSLHRIFSVPVAELLAHKKGFVVTDWSKEIYSLAAYSYTTTETSIGRKVLTRPLNDTIYFASESLCSEGETGTVEAAFNSAANVVEMISREKNRMKFHS